MSQVYLKLNDLLGLSKEEISNSKINLNMTSDGIECLDIWLQNNEEVKFSYWSHQGELKSEVEKNRVRISM